MRNLSSHRSKRCTVGAFGLYFMLLAFGCTSSNNNSTATAGKSGSGGTTASGGSTAQGGSSATGGKTSSGGTTATGGISAQGGSSATGGSNQGGSSNAGGSATGGSNQGGSSNTDGSASGGSNQGGSSRTGGSVTGGSNQGGSSSSGGSASGGSNQGGSSKTGGSVTGGSSQGGSSSAGGSATGGTASGGSATGGSSNTGGATATGGGAPATALSCTDPVYGSVSIPAGNVISDFETNSLYQYVQEGRGAGALPWYAYASGDVNDQYNMTQTASAVNPMNAANTFVVDSTVHGPCSSKGALHVTSPGDPKGTGGYAGFGIDFMARTATTKKKLAYDASKYTGVGFWAKCNADLQFAFTKTVDAAQDADIDPSVVASPCSYSANTCNQYGVKNAAITKDWSYYKLYFSEVLQDPNGTTFTSGVDKSKLMAFQIHVNPFSPRGQGVAPTANAFDCYIDDVHFLSEPAPTTPAATVTWSTSGNQIKRNGTAYKIRGLVRPSMEWDCAGFAITREDIKRMKTWKPNAIRLGVKDTLWNGGATGAATCNGGAYQKEVKRVISWILQEGIDVILDLHYVGGMPSDANGTFWDTISKDSFFKDGRIIYELYNEPSGDFTTLRNWMDSTAKKIRASGATNLILVSGVDYTYDISGYVGNPITGQGALAYVTHPYIFKPALPGDGPSFLTPAQTLPVIATEFGDAKVPEMGRDIPPTQCTAGTYSDYITKFEGAGMSWTSWAWIVDAWGCGFPQLISDYSGTPNGIGTPVKSSLTSLNP